MSAYYDVNGKKKTIDYDNKTEVYETSDAETTCYKDLKGHKYVPKLSVDEGGGALPVDEGDGEWSLAEVTFMAQWTAQGDPTSYVVRSPSIVGGQFFVGYNEVWSFDEPPILQMPLYNGCLYLPSTAFTDVDFSSASELSGSVTLSGSTFVITGDCTITLKGTP